jgi:hypothetical protein
MVLRRVLTLFAALLSQATDAAWAVPPRTPAPEPFVSKYKPGTIVVRIRERRLYHLTDPGQAGEGGRVGDYRALKCVQSS